jgi:hypothetical protein
VYVVDGGPESLHVLPECEVTQSALAASVQVVHRVSGFPPVKMLLYCAKQLYEYPKLPGKLSATPRLAVAVQLPSTAQPKAFALELAIMSWTSLQTVPGQPLQLGAPVVVLEERPDRLPPAQFVAEQFGEFQVTSTLGVHALPVVKSPAPPTLPQPFVPVLHA